MRPIIYPYKSGSQGAKALSEELKSRGHRSLRVKPDGKYKPYNNHMIINWGCSTIPAWLPNEFGGKVFNHFGCVKTAGNKLLAFEALEAAEVSIPEFTTDPVQANAWRQEGWLVVARHKLQGHSGDGIELISDSVLDHSPAPLYVKYIKKIAEYRIHVFKGKVIDVQQKRKRQEVNAEDVNYKIRNHQNGWVYCREHVEPNQAVLDNALDACDALGLDFGAVDVIWNQHHNQAFVLEVNTAPGLEGTTLTNYANAIEELL